MRVLEQVVLVHRFNRPYECQSEPVIDYELIRDVCYKYSLRSQANFMREPALAFLMAHFCVVGQRLLHKKHKFSQIPTGERMVLEAHAMYEVALAAMDEKVETKVYANYLKRVNV